MTGINCSCSSISGHCRTAVDEVVPRLAHGSEAGQPVDLNRITLALKFNLRCRVIATPPQLVRFQAPRIPNSVSSSAIGMPDFVSTAMRPSRSASRFAILPSWPSTVCASAVKALRCDDQIVKLFAGHCEALVGVVDLLQRTQLALQVGHLRLEPFHRVAGWPRTG